MGVSREHVRRIEKRALDKLRLELEKKGIYKSEEVSF
jgi:DNA-directed RNA polymerase sigma subunit (sigma70/sigma32)